MKRWMLIKASEDGRPISWLDIDELSALLADPGSHGVKRFLGWDEAKRESDPAYWPEDVALLVSFEVQVPKPVVTAWELA